MGFHEKVRKFWTWRGRNCLHYVLERVTLTHRYRVCTPEACRRSPSSWLLFSNSEFVYLSVLHAKSVFTISSNLLMICVCNIYTYILNSIHIIGTCVIGHYLELSLSKPLKTMPIFQWTHLTGPRRMRKNLLFSQLFV